MTTIPQLAQTFTGPRSYEGAGGTARTDVAAPPAPLTLAPARSRAAAAPWNRLLVRVRRAVAVLDVVVAALVAALALLATTMTRTDLLWALGIAAGLPALVWLLGGTSVRQLRRGTYGRSSVVRAGAAAGLGALAAVQLTGSVPSAAFTLVGLPAVVGLMYLTRTAAAGWVRRTSVRGRTRPRAVVVGTDEHVRSLLERHHPNRLRYEVLGWCADSPEQRSSVLPILGDLEDVVDVVIEHEVDHVLVAGSLPAQRLRQLSTDLAETGSSLVLAPGVAELGTDRVHVLPVSGAWELEMLLEPRRQVVRGKTALDRVLGALLLLAAAPVIAVAAAAVRLTSPGPAFYGQTRVGLAGRPFRMWKLRSMVQDADARRADLEREATSSDGVLFKLQQDPRITSVGGFLRRFSIDELPQLWNVVRGDMSLVGPRPPLPTETAQYRDEEHRRLVVKPGLTGLWQVGGRSDLSWAESVRLDLRYVDNWSMAMDLRVLAATARAVVGGNGAY